VDYPLNQGLNHLARIRRRPPKRSVASEYTSLIFSNHKTPRPTRLAGSTKIYAELSQRNKVENKNYYRTGMGPYKDP